MPILCCPSVKVPEHTITLTETLQLASSIHHDHKNLKLAHKLIENTGVQTRQLVQPIERTLQHPGFEERNKIYVREAKSRIPAAVFEALENSSTASSDIDAIIFVSCTGFTMPALSAWIINELGFRSDTCQIPIAQLGCAAGGAAINRAHDFCLAHPGANVLIVACEFCSLCYQPTDLEVGNLLSNGLFGDAIAAAVVRSQGGTGVQLERNGSYLVPNTEEWISYAVKATGFHFLLDRRVPGTMKQIAPVLRKVTADYGWDVADLDFYLVHAGGPRILNDLVHFLEVKPQQFDFSRATLVEHGNIASATVFDALRRAMLSGSVPSGARGLIAGFGPGITAEISLGTYQGEYR